MKKIILASLLFSLATLVNATLTITLTANSIDENSAAVTTIGTVSATGGTGIYAYTVQDSNTFSFNIGANNSGIVNNNNNFIVRPAGNTNSSNDVTIATLNFLSSASTTAAKLVEAINVLTANTGVSATVITNNTVRLDSWPASLDGAELIGFNTNGYNVVITITSTGNDKIIPTPTADFFSIDAATGVLKSKVSFDFEVKSAYDIVIRATDNDGISYAKNFTIDIINDSTDGLTLSPTAVAENNAIGITVGTLATADGTEPYSYTVSNANTTNKTFTFNVGEVDIAANDVTNIDVDFTVKAISGTETSIAVINFLAGTGFASLVPATALTKSINEISLLTGILFSATANTSAGTVTLTDWPDEYDGAELIGFSPYASDGTTLIDYITISEISAGAGLTLPNYAPFSIDGDKLITTAVLDQATQSSYTITISSTDSADTNPVTISRDFTITVAPGGTVTGITLAPNTITNQAADGATVGFLSTNATDTGRAYALDNNTANFSISGNKLTTNQPNLLQTGTISVSISTLSGDNTIFTQSLTITVTNDPAFSLDVDGNGVLSSSNDGLVIFKYLLNSNTNNLHTTIAGNVIESRKTTAQLKAYLDNAITILDVDGNGVLSSSNDGLVIFKYLLNPNSNNLHTTIANDALDGRKTTAQLKAYLDSHTD